MVMLYPFRFDPVLMERVWGGDALARYQKTLPPGKLIGESWEICDRDETQSIAANGPLAGKSLRELIAQFGADLLGRDMGPSTRFPLLIKILDARERLSLQVHPPATVASKLGGEPKTEMWYIVEAKPDAHLIAGLRKGVTARQFEDAIQKGGPAFQECFHRFPVSAGQAFFVPSGRLHAIDAGLVIVEIQQNSDTTYRVYDWDRGGRKLHIPESLASIDFTDFEPGPSPLPIECEFFRVEKVAVKGTAAGNCDGSTFHILACISGCVSVGNERLQAGDFALLPAAMGAYTLTGDGAVLRVLRPE
jgi:mannose-6-phosphate isomerase